MVYFKKGGGSCFEEILIREMERSEKIQTGCKANCNHFCNLYSDRSFVFFDKPNSTEAESVSHEKTAHRRN